MMDSKFISSEWQDLGALTFITWLIKFFNIWYLIRETVTFYKKTGKVVATAFKILAIIAYPSLHLMALIISHVMYKRTLAWYVFSLLAGLDLTVMLSILGHYLLIALCGRYRRQTIPTPSFPMEVPFYRESSHCHDPPPKYDDVEAPPPGYDSLFPSLETTTTEMVTSAATLQNGVNLPSTRV